MKIINLIFVLAISLLVIACNQQIPTSSQPTSELLMETESSNFGEIESSHSKGFVHGIVVQLDGDDYYFAGAPDGPNGEIDVPGHYWVQTGPKRFVGKHFNTGPFGAAQWWSSDAEDGKLLYVVKGVIDTWTAEKAQRYAKKGFMHYHEFIKVSDGTPHPSKVVWLKHIARTRFTLDGGPHPELSHAVKPGIDFEFIPNWFNPYTP